MPRSTTRCGSSKTSEVRVASLQSPSIEWRAERAAAPEPARIPPGDRPTYSSAEGLSCTFEFEGESVRHDHCGEGPPLVLVHGTPWSSFNWRHLLPLLA